jgi:2-polyprenyl-3-methyl-5-hydroxy-6-metoxy-1,4-benzoquinol methylase
MKLRDVVEAWDQAHPAAIHPTREHESETAYWASGEAQAEQLAAVLKPGSRVVDFGCGDGRVAIPLAARGYQVTGADSSAAMLARLNKRAPELPTVQASGPDLHTVLGRKTDAVICLAVLIHHGYEDGLAIIRGLAAAARKGGLLVLDWPTSNQPHERTHWIDVTTWSPARQADAAQEAGLIRVDSVLPWSMWRA